MCTKLEKLLDRLPTTLTPNDAATRNTDTARTLDGRVPIDRPYVWICPRRPTVATQGNDVDNASQRYYCPECDWSDYYCLCSTLKAVGPCDSRLLALEKRREEETGLVGYTVDRCSAAVRGGGGGRRGATTSESVLQRTTWPDVDDGTPAAGRHTLQPAGRRVGSGQGGAVAVDEGGDAGSKRCSMEATKPMATTGQRDDADGSDAGRSCRRRTRDVLLTVEDLVNAGCEDDNEAEFSDDEELELFLKAYDEGQVRICCEWTAAPLASEGRTEAVDEPYRRKVAVWKRSWAADQQQEQQEEEDDPMDDDDDEDLTRALDEWEEESAVAEAVDRAIEEHYAVEKLEEETSPASPPPPPPPPEEDWKTPRNAILYTTRRWEVVPRASKRLEAKEHARWVAAAQASIDAEDEWRRKSEELGVDEKLAEVLRRRTSTPKRKRQKKKMLTPRSKLLATGSERSTARRNLAKIDFK